MKILVTGGAGYIGSFMVRHLLDKENEVTVFDNLERGHREAIDSRANFVKGDLKNIEDIEALLKDNTFDAAIHFAGLIAVGESEENPELYYQNNIVGSRNFFETAVKTNSINNFIFSSSAAVYGNPIKIPIPEDHPKNPTSEYGRNKLAVEEILSEIRKQNPQVRFTALRYFNAAGASLDGSIGENHSPETHIIPNIVNALLSNEAFKLFGNDYDTDDGTCVRDYIHVLDLVEAHMLALEKMISNPPNGYQFNVGTGNGYSNKQVVEMIEKVSGKKIKVEIVKRRPGDADTLVADVSKIKNELNFSAKYSDLETIIKTAWQWHSKNDTKV